MKPAISGFAAYVSCILYRSDAITVQIFNDQKNYSANDEYDDNHFDRKQLPDLIGRHR